MKAALTGLSSATNFVALYLSALAFHIDIWTLSQFAGLYGILELGAGLANVYAANFWRFPIEQLRLESGQRGRLSLRKAHWETLGRATAGFAFLIYAAVANGITAQSVLIVPVVLLVTGMWFGLTAVMGWIGVQWPKLDVLFVEAGWAGKRYTAPPLSLGASFFQLLLFVGALPLMKLLPLRRLYNPHIAPDAYLVTASAIACAVSFGAALVIWTPRWVRRRKGGIDFEPAQSSEL